MRHLSAQSIVITFSILLILALPGHVRAWVGLELDAKATAIEDRYGLTGSEGTGSLWEFSGRIIYQESFGILDTEFHWLGQGSRTAGEVSPLPGSSGSLFRSLDMENMHSQDDRTTIYSEIDRLSLTLNTPEFVLSAGRQAVSWGEAYYFNFGDLFGAFPVTETNRRYKPGIDALTATVTLGAFSDISLAIVPVEDEGDSIAAHMIGPLGPGTFSITGGRILMNDKAGVGYTVDIAGTQFYGSALYTRAPGADSFPQAVAGAQRQTGPYTLLVAELYYNGWATGDPDDYPFQTLADEFLSGNVLTLGKYNLALQMSRQVSPLLTLTPALFSNFSDGSSLVRLDGSYSISDFTDMTGGIFLGLGERPDGGIPKSEYGSVPISLYIEFVHNI